MKNHLLGISLANNALLEEVLIDDAIKLSVSILGESHGCSNCCIFQVETESRAYCYNSTTKITKIKIGNNLNFLFPQIKEVLKKNKPFYGYTDELKFNSYKAYFELRNMKSFLFTPIFSRDKLWGYVIYEYKEKIDWIVEEIRSLQLIAKNIGTRIYKDLVTELLGDEINNLNYYMNGTNQAMWELDLLTKIPVFSYYWAEMIGYEKKDIEHTYEFWRKNVHPEDILNVERNLYNYINAISTDYNSIMRMKHKKGHYVWIKYSGLIKRDDHGNPIKIVGTHVDVTDIKEKEIELQISEEKYKFITENTTDIICQLSLDGKFIFISKSFEEILGYEISEMMNKVAFNFIHPEDTEFIINSHKKFIVNEKIEILTYRFRKKDNTYIWLETTSKKILNTDNNVIGIQSCSRDVNNRIESSKKLEMALVKEKQLSEMKSDFVSMASHQFRTPLTVIYSNTELLDLKASKLEEKTATMFKPITNRIKEEVDRMTELMNNILVFAQYETQKLKKDVKPLNFDEFIKTLIETYFRNTSDGREIKVTTIGKRKPFYSDESLLIHILTNLINNAFKYSVGKESPTLLITYLDDTIDIELTDYGIGIPENEIQNLFTSFFRASNTNTIIGSGLGLSIVKQFTHFLNGKIELISKENVGTTLKLQYPYE